MQLKLGFSPCPNDTFMFDALVHKKINTEGLDFDVVLADIEQLNRDALNTILDVTKLSFNAFIKCNSHYDLLDSGAALGVDCGPILIKKPTTIFSQESSIAIPGKNTTANLLLSIARPEYSNKYEILFSDIEDAILAGKFDAGLIIHENRFTYQSKGLQKIEDLGESWQVETNLPLPLGGIAIKNTLSLNVKQKVSRVLRRSIEYAFLNRQSSLDFIKANAQEIEDEVLAAHINLYVNEYSVSLGSKGRQSVETLFKKAGIDYDGIFV